MIESLGHKLGHATWKNVQLGTAKSAFFTINGSKNFLVGGPGGALVGGAQGATAGVDVALTSPAGIIGVSAGLGILTAISAALSQFEYRYEIDNIKELYKDEIAAKLGKAPGLLTRKDVYKIADGDRASAFAENNVIGDAVDKAKKHRALGIGLSLLATAGTLAAFAIPGVGGIVAALPVAHWLAEAVVGVAIYNAFKTPLHWAGHKLLGLDYETTHDHIEHIARERAEGKQVSRERVLETFVTAHKELDEFIENEYGIAYEKMNDNGKRRVADQVSQFLPINEITAALNSGKMEATELAFTVEGQVSGAMPKQPEQKKDGLIKRCMKIFRSKDGNETKIVESVVIKNATPTDFIESETRTTKFSDKVGRRQGVSMSHVERLEQQVITPSVVSNSIH